MPELPEVETVVRGLAPGLIGEVTATAWTDWPRLLEGCSLEELNAWAGGRTVTGLFRRGKYIIIDLNGAYLLVHLRMTGRLYLSDSPRGDDRWVHFAFELESGRYLAFSDARKFGKVTYCEDLAFLEDKLGPEPLGLKPRDFRTLFRGSKRAVKIFLLDQKRLAGVGNIYADEALFRAGIHPAKPVDRLRVAERERLGATVQAVLNEAIDHEGATISWYRKPDGSQGESQRHFRVYGRGGEPCLVCGTSISKIVLGQRGTHFCRKCQRG